MHLHNNKMLPQRNVCDQSFENKGTRLVHAATSIVKRKQSKKQKKVAHVMYMNALAQKWLMDSFQLFPSFLFPKSILSE